MRKFLILGLALLSTAAVAEEEAFTVDWHLVSVGADAMHFTDLGSRTDEARGRLMTEATIRRTPKGLVYDFVTVAYRCDKGTSAVVERFPVKSDNELGELVTVAPRFAPVEKGEAGRLALAAACEHGDGGTLHAPGDNVFTWGRAAMEDPALLKTDIAAARVEREARLAEQQADAMGSPGDNMAMDNAAFDDSNYSSDAMSAADAAMEAAQNAADAADYDAYDNATNAM